MVWGQLSLSLYRQDLLLSILVFEQGRPVRILYVSQCPLESRAARRSFPEVGIPVLLIIDEIPFIGRALFARMHYRTQQGKRRFFSESALDPTKHSFGDLSIILVGDFDQLEPINDWSLCDSAYMTCPKI